MCTVLLPPDVKPIAVKYIISYHTIYTHLHITKPTQTHTHILQNKLKQPKYKIQPQYKIRSVCAEVRFYNMNYMSLNAINGVKIAMKFPFP